MGELPTGTVTFLFTDIDGSTRLWEQDPEAMRAALLRHEALLTQGIRQHGGVVVKNRGEGDSLFAVFARARDAVVAACALQYALLAEPLPIEGRPPGLPLRVRMALHTGEADLRDDDYYGLAVNHCARLRSAAHGGQILVSQATKEAVRGTLPAEYRLLSLGLHRLRDLPQPQPIFQLLHPELPVEFPPLVARSVVPNNLPEPLTSFIGRERELAEITSLLSSTRLLTLTGPGGSGKTRLALRAATAAIDAFTDGAWLVELAPLADPSFLAQTVLSALGMSRAPSPHDVPQETNRPALTVLLDCLKHKQLLLILDNCEHLIDECAQLAEALLRNCPGLRILATSRESLGMDGEAAWRLPSLSMPPAEGVGNWGAGVGSEATLPNAQHPTLDDLLQYEAPRLFVARAASVQAAFQVTEKNAPALVRVCRRLDGIPLAIELAAARTKALSVEQVAARLDDQFRLLTGGSRTALPRQQTLRAAIDWSYDLLTEAERVLLRRLSVFSSGWSLEAAEAICGDNRDEQHARPAGTRTGDEKQPASPHASSLNPQPSSLAPEEVIDLLSRLVDKSLVQYEEQAGEERYRLLEIIRQYGRDRLVEAEEAELFRNRHRDFFLALAERAEPELRGPEQLVWLEQLSLEHDNMRAALEWCLTAEESGQGSEDRAAEAGLRLAAALSRFWTIRGYLSEQRDWLERALSRPVPSGRGRSRARARALIAAGGWDREGARLGTSFLEEGLALYQELGDRRGIADAMLELGWDAYLHDDLSLARTRIEESLAIYREQEDRWGIAAALRGLGEIALRQDDHSTARAYYTQGLALAREMGDRYSIIILVTELAQVAWRLGDMATTRACLLESIALARELNNPAGIAWCLALRANVARHEGDLVAARSLFEECAAVQRARGAPGGLAWALLGAGNVAHAQGEDETARSLYAEALDLFVADGHHEGSAFTLERLAALARAHGQVDRAARLLGAAEAVREAIDYPLPPVDRSEYYDVLVADARTALGEEAFAAAWAEGRAMSLEQACVFALQGQTDA